MCFVFGVKPLLLNTKNRHLPIHLCKFKACSIASQFCDETISGTDETAYFMD